MLNDLWPCAMAGNFILLQDFQCRNGFLKKAETLLQRKARSTGWVQEEPARL